jgi:Spy/CpxP family protein refolding chaperone
MNKKYLNYAILTLVLCTTLHSSALLAEPGKSPKPGVPPHHVDKMKDRREEMKKALGLTEEQLAKLDVIKEESRAEMQKLRADQSLSREEKREQVREIREAADVKIKGILTPEQQAKFEEFKKKRMEAIKDKKDQK